MATMSQRIAKYVWDVRFEDLDAGVRAKAIEQLVYMVGVGFLGLSHPHAAQAIGIAGVLSAGRGDSTVIGQSTRVKPLDAASYSRSHEATGSPGSSATEPASFRTTSS